MDDLRRFLVKAKINTYASNGEGSERVLDDGAKELVFEDDNFNYRDTYYGFSPFAGEEVVRQNDKAVWVMNYYGGIVRDDEMSNKIDLEKVYGFLKKALRQVKEDRPFRGPENLKEGYFEYINEVTENIESFVGAEKILYKGEEVYKLNYHGGVIGEK